MQTLAADLVQIIAHVHPAAVFGMGGNVTVIDDGTGQRIARWNEATLGPQPSPEDLESHRADTEAALAAAQAVADQLAAGYTVPGIEPPLVLDLSDVARAQFTGLLVLMREAGAPDEMPWTIAGTDNVPRQFPVSQIRLMILGYGNYYAQLWAASL